MNTFKYLVLAAFVAAFALAPVAPASAVQTNVAVVDVQKILSTSEPGKAAAAHMKEVQQVLQKGMNDFLAMQKDTKAPEVQKAIADAQQVLNRQFNLEQQATNRVLEAELRAAAAAWLRKNRSYKMVINKDLLLASSGTVEFTTGVLKEMNLRKPKFPDLPKVTINRPEPKNDQPQNQK
ncbi:MAG: hypothetical protein ACOYD9_08950 [Pyramidobacter sp.]|jgi:Skp family chaperone for outer membrane proteins